jgi:hypothetical protein
MVSQEFNPMKTTLGIDDTTDKEEGADESALLS